jgi:hypothetical protein
MSLLRLCWHNKILLPANCLKSPVYKLANSHSSTTLSRSSALEPVPLQTVEMAEGHGFLYSVICGPWDLCSCKSLGTSDLPEYYKCLKPRFQIQSWFPDPLLLFFLNSFKNFIISTFTHNQVFLYDCSKSLNL